MNCMLKRTLAVLCLGPAALFADEAAADAIATSPTEIVNQRLPKWVRLSGELRARGEGFYGDHFTEGRDDLFLLQRVRVGLQIKPTSWLQFFAQGQDARISFQDKVAAAPPYQDSVDLRQAYVQLGGGEKAPLLLRVGRQDLKFGEERLVGASNWGNIARSFDAVRLGFQHGGYHVDAFASSVVVPRDHAFDRHVQGDNLHGLYGGIDHWIPKGKLEPFLFWRLAPVVRSDGGSGGRLDGKTFGFRWTGQLPGAIEYGTEMAAQRGSWAGDDVSAWAGLWRIGRAFDSVKWTPKLRV